MDILKYYDLPQLREAIEGIADSKNIRILFVCLGNICRSPAAEGLMLTTVNRHRNSARWSIDSAGTGRYHIGQLPDPRMRAHARRRDIELTHHCRQVTTSDFFDFDIIFGMDDANISNLRAIAPSPESERKILPMSMMLSSMRHFDHIPDPYYNGAEGFENVLNLLTESTENLYDTILANIH